jgi:hypothetical protein
VLVNAVPTFTDTNSNPDLTGLNWEQFTHTFVATGTSTTLGFQNDDPSNDNSNGLDNVVLTDLGPVPVPAPSIGFGLPAFMAVGGLWFGAGLLGRSRWVAGLFGMRSLSLLG